MSIIRCIRIDTRIFISTILRIRNISISIFIAYLMVVFVVIVVPVVIVLFVVVFLCVVIVVVLLLFVVLLRSCYYACCYCHDHDVVFVLCVWIALVL